MRKNFKNFLRDIFFILLITNSLIMSVIIISHLILEFYEHYPKKNYLTKLNDLQKSIYKGLSAADLEDLLYWTWSPGFVYESQLGYREKPRISKYVNVSTEGIRKTGKGADSLKEFTEESIFVFGGSSTFGYGIKDSETIPSYLQNLIDKNIKVFNFGRGYYYSAQENFLFQSLLDSGIVPKVAIFLDGINERCENDIYQHEFGILFEQTQGYSWGLSEFFYPVINLSRKIFNRVIPTQEKSKTLFQYECFKFEKKIPLSQVFITNLENRGRLCKQMNVHCLSFLQPFAGIHGVHLDFRSLNQNQRDAMATGYRYFQSLPISDKIIDISYAISSLKRHGYVDDVHYSPEANELIAKEIFKYMDIKNELK